MKVALYARVSTVDKNQNPETQLVRLREHAKANRMEVVGEYVDHASGRNMDRPELRRILDDAAKGGFETILITRIDRFSRSVKDLTNSIERLETMNVNLICTEQPIETASAVGRFLRHILSAVAELESELISERICEGHHRARLEGVKFGRPPVPIDWKRVKDAVRRAHGNVVRACKIMAKEGMPIPYSTIQQRILALPEKEREWFRRTKMAANDGRIRGRPKVDVSPETIRAALERSNYNIRAAWRMLKARDVKISLGTMHLRARDFVDDEFSRIKQSMEVEA